MIGGGGFVVRVAGVGVDGYVRDIGDGACLLQEGEKALLDAVFIEWLIRTQPVAKFLEEGVLGGDDALAGLAVGGYLFTGQLGLETLGYIGRTDYLYAKGAYQVDGAAIDARHVGDGVEGRVFHGYAHARAQEFFEVCLHFLPCTEDAPCAGQ